MCKREGMADETPGGDGAPNRSARRARFMGVGVALGISIGVAIGTAMDQLAVGVGIGVAIGVALDAGEETLKR
ncbi:MAG: hypothetical protein M3442_13465 [Chloroflexota bacterium]|nr:hypothetical protein [Chloroflexota bacterium]